MRTLLSVAICCLGAAGITGALGDEGSTVQGGMSVAVLRLAAGSGQPSKLVFGEGDGKFTMGVEPNGSLSLKSSTAGLMSVDSNDRFRILTPVLETGSLEVNGDFTVKGVKQFRMVASEDYSTGVAPGWDNTASEKIVSECAGIHMLGGFGKFAKGEVVKKFDHLPPHSELRVKATYHFIDAWIGETGFMRLSVGPGESLVHVWTERHSQNMEQESVNACGGAVGEGKFAVPVDITVPHNSDSVSIGFGSTMEADDPYDQSWGVSGLEIYVK